jgi:hypothetical protein
VKFEKNTVKFPSNGDIPKYKNVYHLSTPECPVCLETFHPNCYFAAIPHGGDLPMPKRRGNILCYFFFLFCVCYIHLLFLGTCVPAYLKANEEALSNDRALVYGSLSAQSRLLPAAFQQAASSSSSPVRLPR